MTKCKICKKEVSELYTSDKWELVCRECLERSIYKQRRKEIKKSINKKGGEMKITKILIAVGTLMILAGIIIQIIGDQKKIRSQKEEITELRSLLDQVATDNNRLKTENEILWDKYYIAINNQEG